MGLPVPISSASWNKRLRMFLNLAIVASVSQLCEGSFVSVDWGVGGTLLAHRDTNTTNSQLSSGQLSTKDQNCSFLVRVADATRRRRNLLFQQNADAAVAKTFAPYSHFRTSALSGVGMSFLAGLSTTIGAGIVFVLPQNQDSQISASQMSFVLALAAGVMLSVTVFEFWLPAFASASTSTAANALFFSAIGSMSFLLLSRFVPEPDFVEADVETQGCRKDQRSGQSWHLAQVLLLSITAHNFPEGFAVVVSSLGSGSLGLVVMLAIAMHNIPEGIAIAVPVLAATGSRTKALWWTFLSGMAEPAGALLGLFLADATGMVTHVGVENLLCVVGGIMFVVAVKELLPGAWSYGKPLSFTVGLLMGFFLMLATIVLGA